jgi:hypothetical protein
MRDVQQEIIDNAGRRMAQEMDFGVLCSFLEELGWSKVILKPMTMEQGMAVDAWTAAYVKGKFETLGLVWIFERKEDATWFTLRWSA